MDVTGSPTSSSCALDAPEIKVDSKDTPFSSLAAEALLLEDFDAVERELLKISEFWKQNFCENPMQNNSRSAPGTPKGISKTILDHTLAQPASQALLSPGKRMRPLLCLWAMRNELNFFESIKSIDSSGSQESLRSGHFSHAMRIGVATEILHSASLIVDDIQDGSTERRGQPTLHTIFGVPIALNVGNWMYFEALEYLAEIPCSEALSREAVSMLRRCHIGQALDLGSAETWAIAAAFDMSQSALNELYESIARNKTAELMRYGVLSVLENAHSLTVATAFPPSRPSQHCLIETGRLIELYGLIYQKVDDLRNLSSALSGSKAFEDLQSIRNFVVIRLIGHLSAAERSSLLNAFQLSLLDQSKNCSHLITGHPVFSATLRMAVQEVKDDLDSAHDRAKNLCCSLVSLCYFENIIHKPLQNLLHIVIQEAHSFEPFLNNDFRIASSQIINMKPHSQLHSGPQRSTYGATVISMPHEEENCRKSVSNRAGRSV